MSDKPKSPSTELREANSAELDIAMSGPAFASNRAIIVMGPPGVRISFVEQWDAAAGGTIHFRTAVLLSVQDAISLKKSLNTLLQGVEEQIEVAIKATSDGDK